MDAQTDTDKATWSLAKLMNKEKEIQEALKELEPDDPEAEELQQELNQVKLYINKKS